MFIADIFFFFLAFLGINYSFIWIGIVPRKVNTSGFFFFYSFNSCCLCFREMVNCVLVLHVCMNSI